MTTSTTTNNTQTIKLLTLLQHYEILHTTANDNLKSSIFNITKARKFGSSSGQQYSPDDVREELRASALLELQDDIEVDGNIDIEPNLVQEDVPLASGDDDVKISGGVSKGSRKFVLHLDRMRDVEKQQTASTDCQHLDDKAVESENLESDGLRRRRKGKTDGTKSSSEDRSNKDTSDKNKWTIEDETLNETNKEEQRLQSTDPINLFGVPPPALKVAQTKSRYAIAYYVEVANLAREIMNITNQD